MKKTLKRELEKKYYEGVKDGKRFIEVTREVCRRKYNMFEVIHV